MAKLYKFESQTNKEGITSVVPVAVYENEDNDIKSFFLDHINHRLNDFDPLYDRFEIVSNKEIGAGYLYYIINDTKENILYKIFYDANRKLLAMDYTLFTY